MFSLRFRFLQTDNAVYKFLSGVKVTPDTKFLSPSDPCDVAVLREVYHYMHFAIGVYGWPMYLRRNKGAPAACKLCLSLRSVIKVQPPHEGLPTEPTIL